jgi:hypothetical protein
VKESELMLSNISEIWPLVLSAVFVIIWLIRLEAKVLYLEKQNEHRLENDKMIWDKFEAVQSTLTNILQSLARLEGKLEGRHDNM